VRVELHPEARLELRSAALWYDEQTTVSVTGSSPRSLPRWWYESIQLFPIWPGLLLVGKSARPVWIGFRIGRVPILESRALVLALAHASRRPLYWFYRLAADES
jgi:hypothetical protein